MEFMIKSGVFTFLISAVFCRSVSVERNLVNSSEISDTECDCKWRYLKHYEAKNCQVEQEDSCGCPTKYDCPLNQTEQYLKVCKYQSKEYRVGSKIITSDVCQLCRCYDGVPPHIKCIPKECFPPEPPPSKNCHLVYKESKCCPTHYECVETETEEANNRSFTCEYNDDQYPLGAKIYPFDDPCQICYCNENWKGVDNSSCYQHECMFEKNKDELDAGCIPVYHESRCCPIEFYCPSSKELNYASISENSTSIETFLESGDFCIFAGKMYQVGMELPNNNSCIKCSCQVPPDITCVHQSCPIPPNSEDCYTIYNPEECCPRYDCLLGDESEVPEFGDSESEEVCPTPQCADESCHIDTPPGHQCPTCICKESSTPVPQNLYQTQQQLETLGGEDRFFEEESQNIDDDLVEVETLTKKSISSSNHAIESEKVVQLESDDDNEINLKNDENVHSQLSSDSEIDEGSDKIEKEDQVFLEKRSENFGALPLNTVSASTSQQQSAMQQAQSALQLQHGYSEELEREDETAKESDENFDDLESFREKATVQKTDNQINHSEQQTENNFVGSDETTVPSGCPTPMCANSSCHIGILPGHHCPTCICKQAGIRQP